MLEAVVEGVYAVDQERNIRYLNPQAARLLGVEPAEAIGKFCGDVLKPCGPGVGSGTRPCTTTACPILRARQAGSAQSVEQLQTRSGIRQTVITSSRVVNGLQVQVMRDETELEGVRRARDTVLANVVTRIPHAARGAARVDRAAARRAEVRVRPKNSTELVLSLERGTLRLTRLIDNLLESVRIESGQLDVRRQSIELARRDRRCARAGRGAAAPAPPDARGRRAGGAHAAGRRHAAHAGVRESHRQCQQVRARGHARCASARESRRQSDQRLGRGCRSGTARRRCA